MSGYNITEEEQIEQIKQWWKKYGASIIIGIILGLILMYGYQYWHAKKIETSAGASKIYEELMQYYQNDELDTAADTAKRLTTEYPDSAYADLSYLFLAQVAVQKGESATAMNYLQKVTTNASFKQVATLRIARILIGEGNYEKALNLLLEPIDKAYSVAVDELRGDILLNLGRAKEAKVAFERALQDEKKDATASQRLQSKLQNLIS